MAKFRRQALTAAAALCFASWCGLGSTETAARLQLELTGETGALRIFNPGAAAVGILPAIAVQKKESASWIAILTEFNAVSSCTASGPPDTVEIAAGATLTLVPWKGYSCSGQCVLACRANVYYGHGTFRFVVTRIPGMQTDTSPEFTLPAER
jgi:hypothetical protein